MNKIIVFVRMCFSELKKYLKLFFNKIKTFLYKLFKPLICFFAKRKLDKILNDVSQCSTFFGLPGCGKTSFCAYIVWLCLHYGKNPKKVYSNVPIKGAIQFDKDQFGRFDMSGAVILIDEGSLYYDNRSFDKNFNQASLEYLKLLRHRHNSVLIFSQSLDVDIKWIRMSQNVYQIKRCSFGRTRVSRSIRKVDINEQTHKWEDFYYKLPRFIAFFKDWRFLRRRFYHMFDSYEAPALPKMVEKVY